MDMTFSDKTEAALIADRTAILAQTPVDEKALRLLEDEAMTRLNLFLNGEETVDPEDSPLFYSFIKVFGETENTDLKVCAKKAEAKITPILKQFDHFSGYDDLNKLCAEDIERNCTDLDCFEKVNPFERDSAGNLVFPQFGLVEKVVNSVEIVEDDGNAADISAESFKETILETAKIKIYMRLCISNEEITREQYLNALQIEMEKALVILFVMDKAAVEFPLDSAKAEQIHAEFQKLTDVLE